MVEPLRNWHVGSSSRSHTVRRHDGGDAGRHGISERRQLDTAQSLDAVPQDRQIVVAVRFGVTVAWEMLCTRRHATDLHGRDQCRTTGSHRSRFAGE